MFSLQKILLDGSLLTGIASLIILIIMKVNPRIFLHDYPKEIQEAVQPKTETEMKLSKLLGIPFLLVLVLTPFFSTLNLKPEIESFGAFFINAFGVSMVFNIADWLVLDWLIFCTITPNFMVIPGTKGMKAYKDYAFHFRGFLIGCVISAATSLVIAGVVLLIG